MWCDIYICSTKVNGGTVPLLETLNHKVFFEKQQMQHSVDDTVQFYSLSFARTSEERQAT